MNVEQLDTFIKVHFSADKLSASITFIRLTDDFSITVEQLRAFLQSKGIVFGFIEQVLQQICTQPLDFLREQPVVAVGESAVSGNDGYIDYLLGKVSKSEQQSSKEDIDKVDLKNIMTLENVRQGQPVARLMEPGVGEPGRTVTGDIIPAKLGKPARFKPGKNVVISEEQKTMYATIDGIISLTDRDKVNVFPLYEINGDVDYRIGNITFVGTVVIRGNVLTGFKVQADGDIRVIGGVEGAELIAGGSIEVTGGIMAGHKGFIKASGQLLRSSFIQDANVSCGGDIIVSQSIMHSQIKAGGHIICEGNRGLIVGGTVQAGTSVLARTIGNAMSTTTVIEVGVQPHLREELLELRKVIRAEAENLDKTEKALTILDQMAATGKLTPERLAMRLKFNTTRRQLIDQLDEAKSRVLEIEKSLDSTELARVEVTGQIFGGSRIVIGRYTKFIKDSAKRVSFRYYEGDIVMYPL
ncbi:DUF342 domain-containing protein [Paenibacillus yanchengensis]|uniref:DUF342 domain-containing protein n=1 Tax=Paenibacillus yanchengensis TaxID=2035833 RepID=A0ABW4YMS9_9BACL